MYHFEFKFRSILKAKHIFREPVPENQFSNKNEKEKINRKENQMYHKCRLCYNSPGKECALDKSETLIRIRQTSVILECKYIDAPHHKLNVIIEKLQRQDDIFYLVLSSLEDGTPIYSEITEEKYLAYYNADHID